MKNLILFALCVSVSPLFSQLTVDAGEYKTACKSMSGVAPIVIGGNPSAQGGVPPYTYSWHAHHQNVIGSFTFNYYASHFLDDTTSANPTLNNFPPDVPVIFKLTVTDDEGNVDSSFVDIRVSFFGINLGSIHYNVLIGDSVFHNFGTNIGGGILPYQEVIWRPNEGLVDSTLMNGFWIKPTSSQNYYMTLTDAAGCTISGGTYIYVNAGYANIENHEISASYIYPNPSSSFFTVSNPEQIKTIQIFDVQGKLMATSKQLPMNIEYFPPGIYSVHLETHEGQVIVERLLFE